MARLIHILLPWTAKGSTPARTGSLQLMNTPHHIQIQVYFTENTYDTILYFMENK